MIFAHFCKREYDKTQLDKGGHTKNSKKSPKTGHKNKNRVAKKTDVKVEIMGVVLSGTQKKRVLSKVALQRKKMLHVATVNPEYIMEARVNPRFANILAQCLSVADGWGVVWANRILNHKSANSLIEDMERISGMELVEDILQIGSEQSEKVFLLGGGEGVAKQAELKMSKKYPNLQIYSYGGAKSVRAETSEEASTTIAKINAVSPDYLLVAYGSPWQDIWIEENRPYLRVKVAMGVGGVLDEWAGLVAVCPAWIDRIGCKWVWRGAHEPWRWKRILRVLQFGWLVVWQRIARY